jgi:hypothetical protein
MVKTGLSEELGSEDHGNLAAGAFSISALGSLNESTPSIKFHHL